jgi:DEAD/DEAH box helicase domain-containing protein
MDVASFLHYLITLPNYKQQIAHVEHIPRREPIFGKLDRALKPALQTRFESLNMPHLYSHQTKALNAIFSGKNVIITTASASGKSLCYHLATLETILEDKHSCAIYIFPTSYGA